MLLHRLLAYLISAISDRLSTLLKQFNKTKNYLATWSISWKMKQFTVVIDNKDLRLGLEYHLLFQKFQKKIPKKIQNNFQSFYRRQKRTWRRMSEQWNVIRTRRLILRMFFSQKMKMPFNNWSTRVLNPEDGVFKCFF